LVVGRRCVWKGHTDSERGQRPSSVWKGETQRERDVAENGRERRGDVVAYGMERQIGREREAWLRMEDGERERERRWVRVQKQTQQKSGSCRVLATQPRNRSGNTAFACLGD
jgi:hypothetical protein